MFSRYGKLFNVICHLNKLIRSFNNFQALLEMYKEEVLCDVELVVGTHNIMAHKVILAATSPYFRYAPNLQISSD